MSTLQLPRVTLTQSRPPGMLTLNFEFPMHPQGSPGKFWTHPQAGHVEASGTASGPPSAETSCSISTVWPMGSLHRHLQGMLFPGIHFLSPDLGCFHHFAHPQPESKDAGWGTQPLTPPPHSFLPSLAPSVSQHQVGLPSLPAGQALPLCGTLRFQHNG